MNKYDTQLDLENINSLSYMIKNIRPNSSVLEFGPATGYMTKYLKEEMNCKVSIIEIDEEAYEKALVYSEDGFCGNIEQYEWTKKFKGKKFDFITFSDVLEHLLNPEKALKTAIQFLKPNGYILISIPNIAHNAVIVDLMHNKFSYRKTGILDNTHLRFFTYESLQILFKQCELCTTDENSVNLGFEFVNFENSLNDVAENTARQLDLRPLGYVYQFLFQLKRKKDCTKEEMNKKKLEYKKEIPCVLYQWENDNFSEDTKVFSSLVIQDYHFTADFNLNQTKAVKVRFDPCEFSCKIENFQVNSNIKHLKINVGETGTKIGTQDCFFTNDPFYVVEAQENLEWIQFSGKLNLLTETDWQFYMNHLKEIEKKSIDSLEKDIKRMNTEMQKMSEEIHRLDTVVETKQKEIDSASLEIQKLNEFRKNENEESAKEIHRLNEAVLGKQEEIFKASQVIEEKNKELGQLSINFSQTNEKLEQMQVKLEQMQMNLEQKEMTLNETQMTLNETQEFLERKKKELVQVYEKLDKTQTELGNACTELEQIHRSKLWKLYQLFHKKNI